MCTGNPTEMLELSRARLTPEQWAKFDADFQHFCDYSGMVMQGSFPHMPLQFAWAKWAYLCGKGL